MSQPDLRGWLVRAGEVGCVRTVEGASCRGEIGQLSELNSQRQGPTLLFDRIDRYPPGYRVLTCATSSAATRAITLGLDPTHSPPRLAREIRERFARWEESAKEFDPVVVGDGPVLENVRKRGEVDLRAFPVPLWHEGDGGPYIGTGDAVITRDPDTGEINLGTYRVMVADEGAVTLYISPGHHGAIHRDKYEARNEPCPVVVVAGLHPLLSGLASTPLLGGTEYHFAGAVLGEPVQVVREEVTGLPMPAHGEIALAGWWHPGETADEGPYGEWTGYYVHRGPAPVIRVERLYFRNEPILTGPAVLGLGKAMVYRDLVSMGVGGIEDVALPHYANQQLIVVAIRQQYAGHARQAALLASQSRVGAYHGRYVVVVDEDIDPDNMAEVWWAMCTRVDPEKDIDILRRCWSTPLDPTIPDSTRGYFNARAIIDATRPFERLATFPRVWRKAAPEKEAALLEKWGHLLKREGP